jgi:uracil-DNA glycosylase family 4
LCTPKDFEALQQTIVDCRKCPRLVAWRERIAREKVRRHRDEEYWGRPLPAYGDPHAAILVVGLAPAAHGGNRTGRMFTGDRSADWLYEALHKFGFASRPSSLHRDDGLRLHDCLITAAARCAPPQNKPSRIELENCRPFLRQEIAMLTSLRVVIALGRIGFDAFLKAWQESGHALPRPKPAFRHAGEWQMPDGPTLISSYHPSQQNTLTGKLTRPMFHRIFQRARQIREKQVPISFE